MMNKEKSVEKLKNGSIPKLLFTLAVPAVVAQLINVLYNIVDRIYIGRIPEVGPDALTGVGVTFPIIILITAFANLIGMGGAPRASIKLGQKDKNGAEEVLGNCLTLILILSVFLTIIFLVFKEPLLYVFGASSNTIKYSSDYIEIYLLGTIFIMLALGLNTFISGQGKAKTAMFSVIIGALLNIILDPIFIYALNLGVRGAAVATVISQAASAAWVFFYLISRKSEIRIKPANMRLRITVIGSIFSLGISPFIMMSTESLVNMVFNSGLQAYGGDVYVGSMTILMSIMQLIVIPVSGFTQGAQPLISYNYGAGETLRVKKTFRLLIVASVLISAVMCSVVVFFPRPFVYMFTSDDNLASLAIKMIPVFLGGIFIFGIQMACQNTFIALGQAKTSVFLACLRKILLLVPLALILPLFFEVNGIYYAEPVADIAAALTTLCVFIFSFRKILSGCPMQESKSSDCSDNG